MTTSSRLRGQTKPVFTLDAGSPVSYADDLKKWEWKWDDKDDSDLTFAEAAAGESQVATLTVTGVFSADATSLWAFLWDNAGTDIDIVFGPWGNATATATQPHFTGTVTFDKPGMSNEAKSAKTTTGADFELDLVFADDPVKVTA